MRLTIHVVVQQFMSRVAYRARLSCIIFQGLALFETAPRASFATVHRTQRAERGLTRPTPIFAIRGKNDVGIFSERARNGARKVLPGLYDARGICISNFYTGIREAASPKRCNGSRDPRNFRLLPFIIMGPGVCPEKFKSSVAQSYGIRGSAAVKNDIATFPPDNVGERMIVTTNRRDRME